MGLQELIHFAVIHARIRAVGQGVEEVCPYAGRRPRPALPEEVALYSPKAMARLGGLPGLTGLWQVSGRADIGFDEMVALDVEYLENASLRTDIALIFRTVSAVATARGAY